MFQISDSTKHKLALGVAALLVIGTAYAIETHTTNTDTGQQNTPDNGGAGLAGILKRLKDAVGDYVNPYTGPSTPTGNGGTGTPTDTGSTPTDTGGAATNSSNNPGPADSGQSSILTSLGDALNNFFSGSNADTSTPQINMDTLTGFMNSYYPSLPDSGNTSDPYVAWVPDSNSNAYVPVTQSQLQDIQDSGQSGNIQVSNPDPYGGFANLADSGGVNTLGVGGVNDTPIDYATYQNEVSNSTVPTFGLEGGYIYGIANS